MGSKLFRDGAKISFTATSWTVRLITVGRSFQSCLFVYIIWGEYHEFRIVQHFRRVIVPARWSSWPLLFKRGVKSNIHPSPPAPPLTRHLRSSRLVRVISLDSITFRTKARYSEPVQIRKIYGDDG